MRENGGQLGLGSRRSEEECLRRNGCVGERRETVTLDLLVMILEEMQE